MLIEKSKIPVIYREKKELDQLANGVHQGIILDVVDFSYTNYYDFIQSDDSFVVILDHLEDPHNLGAIIRTSEAAGVDGIIIPKDRGVTVNSTVIKTIYSSFNKIQPKLPTNFVRCHKSYIVNVNNIKHIDNSIIHFDKTGEIKCYIGQVYRKKFLEVLKNESYTNTNDT